MIRKVFLALAAAASLAQASVIQYNTLPGFLGALSGTPVTTIEFSGIGGSGNDVLMHGATLGGATFTGAGGYLYGRNSGGGFLYGPFGGYAHIALPAGTFAVGLTLNRFYDTTHPTEIELSTGDSFVLTGGGTHFAGFISTTPITQVDVRIANGAAQQGVYNLTSDFILIYDVRLASVPEPGTAALGAGLGAALLLAHWRRRRTG